MSRIYKLFINDIYLQKVSSDETDPGELYYRAERFAASLYPFNPEIDRLTLEPVEPLDAPIGSLLVFTQDRLMNQTQAIDRALTNLINTFGLTAIQKGLEKKMS